jgi:hypothetical protein
MNLNQRPSRCSRTTKIKAALACDDVSEIHALLRDMQLTAQKAIGKRGLRRGRLLSLTNRSLNNQTAEF